MRRMGIHIRRQGLRRSLLDIAVISYDHFVLGRF